MAAYERFMFADDSVQRFMQDDKTLCGGCDVFVIARTTLPERMIDHLAWEITSSSDDDLHLRSRGTCFDAYVAADALRLFAEKHGCEFVARDTFDTSWEGDE